MPVGKVHKHQRGASGVIEQDTELGNFILKEYMGGSSVTEIWKLLQIKYPERKVSRITISRYIQRQLDDISPDNLTDESVGKDVLNIFDNTIESLSEIFSNIRKEMNLEPDQIKRLDQMERKTSLNLTLARRKYKVFQLSMRMANTEIENVMQKFTASLSGKQREELSQIVDKDLFLESEVLSKAENKKYQKYNKAKTKLWYKHFPQHENAEVQ